MTKERSETQFATLSHITNVRRKITKIIRELENRKEDHDKSKLYSPEVEIFDKYSPKLKTLTYGSQEYKDCLKEMGAALNHHYTNNRHHPEYFENGIQGMNLIDIVEMFCDWLAATERHNDGDINKSILLNKERFKYSDDLMMIFKNTIKVFK